MSGRLAVVAVAGAVLVALTLYYRREAVQARDESAARHAVDCNRLLTTVGSMRRGLELTKRDDDPVTRHGAASHLLVAIVAVCTGDEVFASMSGAQFGEARTYRAAAAALQAVEDRVKSQRP